MIKIYVNGNPEQIIPHKSIQDLLDTMNFTNEYIAVAINRICIPRSLFSNRVVQENDQIEILSPMSGG